MLLTHLNIMVNGNISLALCTNKIYNTCVINIIIGLNCRTTKFIYKHIHFNRHFIDVAFNKAKFIATESTNTSLNFSCSKRNTGLTTPLE